MNSLTLFFSGWNWNPLVLGAGAAAAVGFARAFGRRGNWTRFGGALVLLTLALCSPLDRLASGVLFSAHMIQHLLLLLIVPGLLVLSLPADSGITDGARWWARRASPAMGWAAGVGAMWFWHVPELCDAAAGSASVHLVQTLSLLALGTLFWWPLFTPRAGDRLLPGWSVLYLFTACLACTALGILLTLTPVEVCPIFRAPLAAGAQRWAFLRTEIGLERDRQIGGLLMWVPMCFVYMSAIIFELARWHRGAAIRSATGEVQP